MIAGATGFGCVRLGSCVRLHAPWCVRACACAWVHACGSVSKLRISSYPGARITREKRKTWLASRIANAFVLVCVLVHACAHQCVRPWQKFDRLAYEKRHHEGLSTARINLFVVLLLLLVCNFISCQAHNVTSRSPYDLARSKSRILAYWKGHNDLHIVEKDAFMLATIKPLSPAMLWPLCCPNDDGIMDWWINGLMD